MNGTDDPRADEHSRSDCEEHNRGDGENRTPDYTGPNRRTLLKALGVAGTGVATGPLAGVAGGAGTTDETAADIGGPTAGTAATLAAASGPLDRATAEADFSVGPVAGRETECFRPDQGFELYGPTDVNAQSGNQGLSVGLNDAGTVTVFRWPRPSFYDQIKYFTLGRDEDNDIQTLPNTGAFLGLAVETDGTGGGVVDGETGTSTTWLRDWSMEQRYGHDLSDDVVTTYRSDDLGLTVVATDVVAREEDALVRRVEIERDADSPVTGARLVAFENFNLVVSKHPQYPTQDWCEESNNTDRARYDGALDAVIHAKSGVDESTGEPRSVAVAMGFGSASGAHQVGGDAYEPAATPAGEGGPTQDAYDDAADGELRGNDLFEGQTTGALAVPLNFEGGSATESVVFAASEDAADAGAILDGIRGRLDERGFAAITEAKRAWFDELLADAPLPNTDDESTTKLAKRALVTLVTDYDPVNGAIVASIATQSPYGEDWPRDGAYFNYVLDLVGLHDWVGKRNRWYRDIQQTAADPRPSHPNTPPGNWVMNYYGDGVAGGPIPYEIDETGYAVWTMWDHYTVTGEESYLEDVYPAIRRAADYLVECKDPDSGLQCRAFEDDHFTQLTQTIVGASTVWLGLKSAKKAARVLGHDADADRYEARQHELGRAIDEHLYDRQDGNGGEGAYGTREDRAFRFAMSEVVWPVCFTPYTDPETGELMDRPQVDDPLDHPRIQSHLTTDYREAATAFAEPEAGDRDAGLYQAKSLIPLAKARRSENPGSLAQVREGVEWIAKRHATPDTHVMGEVWKVFEENGEREVRSIVSQPHAWEQVLFYLASLEAYPPAGVDFESRTCGSVLEALREGACRGPPVDVTGNGEPPTDPDGDCEYEDVNGDGETDVVDVQALFANREDRAMHEHAAAFDFNDDGRLDVVDVQKLFTEVS
jgi:PKD repeat protein